MAWKRWRGWGFFVYNLVFFLFWQSAIQVTAQSAPQILWQKGYGGSSSENLIVVTRTQDGGFILGGNSESENSGTKTTPGFGQSDYWMVKLDAEGNQQWDQTFGGSGNDALSALKQTSDGGYVAAGTSLSGISGNKTTAGFGGHDYWVIRLNTNGVKQWERSLGGDSVEFLYDAIQSSDGGFVLGGMSGSDISGAKSSPLFGAGGRISYSDYWVIKIDANGDKLWDRSFGGGGIEELKHLQQTSDGGYLLGGGASSGPSGNKTSPAHSIRDFWAVKINRDGNQEWDASFGGTNGYHYLHRVFQTREGGYLLGGSATTGVSGNKTSPAFGSNDYWVVKMDATGTKQWEQAFGGTRDDDGVTFHPTADGGFLLAGTSYSPISGNKTTTGPGGGRHVWLIKIDAAGNRQWEQSMGGWNFNQFSFAGVMNDGSYLFYGTQDSDYHLFRAAPPLTLHSFSAVRGHGFQAQVPVLTGTNYLLQSSSNLTEWTPLSTHRATNGLLLLSDTNSATAPERFYRIRQLP